MPFLDAQNYPWHQGAQAEQVSWLKQGGDWYLNESGVLKN